MFNPLAPWTEKALDGFIREGKKYFVRQTFNRAMHPFDEDIKRCFLLCHYDLYAHAKEHYDALKDDPARFLYEWDNEDDQQKLKIAAAQPHGYKIFSNTFMPDWERHITNRMKQKIRAFIAGKGWKPDGNGVLIDFYPHFGEVMITLRFRDQKLSVKLEEVETMS